MQKGSVRIHKPLFGRQILLVRTGTNESALAHELRNKGAEVIECPKWVAAKAEVDMDILAKLSFYDRILFTSPESVTDFFEVLRNQMIDIRSISATLYGKSTKSVRAIKERGFFAEVVSETDEDGHMLVVGDNHQEREWKGDFYLTSRKEIDREFLPLCSKWLEETDTIIFPSSAAVKVFMESSLMDEKLLEKAELVCLGEKTKAMLEHFGYQADAVPLTPSRADVIHCLIKT